MTRSVIAVLCALPLLAGCGLQGDLERPVPLWGNPPNEGPNDPRTIKAEEERAEAEKARERAERDAARTARAAAAEAAAAAAAEEAVEPVDAAPQ